MKAKRKRHEVGFKAKVGLEALKGIKTVAEIAREYQVHPTQISQWNTTLADRLPDVFTSGPTAEVKQAERDVARLHEKVGELTMELDWLKKKVQTIGTVSRLCELIEPRAQGPSLRKQCAILGIARGSYYYEPQQASAENLVIMRRLDQFVPLETTRETP